MLRKVKSKRRLTEPHISPAVLSLSSTAAATSSSSTALQIVAQVTGQQQFSDMTNSAVAAPAMVANANEREKDKEKDTQQQQQQQQQLLQQPSQQLSTSNINNT